MAGIGLADIGWVEIGSADIDLLVGDVDLADIALAGPLGIDCDLIGWTVDHIECSERDDRLILHIFHIAVVDVVGIHLCWTGNRRTAFVRKVHHGETIAKQIVRVGKDDKSEGGPGCGNENQKDRIVFRDDKLAHCLSPIVEKHRYQVSVSYQVDFPILEELVREE